MNRRAIGWGVLGFGTAGLCLWAALYDAPRIETQLRAMAEAQLQELGADEGLRLSVSGRDITVTGLAANDGGAAAVRAALSQIKGIRALHADLADLPQIAPYVMSVVKDAGLRASGYVPSQRVRARLTPALGPAAAALDLARGAPAGWEQNAQAGLAALAQLDGGTLRLEGQTVIIQGRAKTNADAQAARNALADVALLITDITLMDDGLPIAYTLTYSAQNGGRVTGKLPMGTTLGSIATALALPKIAGDARTSQIGAPQDMSYLSEWAAVLPMIDTLRADTGPSLRRVQAKLIAGADAAAVTRALGMGGFSVQVEETLPPPPPPTPIPAPVPEPTPKPPAIPMSALGFALTPQGCQSASDSLLAKATILFLPNLDTLDDTASAVLQDLAAIMRDCAGAGLRAEIGGHTDTSGNPEENLSLSARRAETVRSGLIAAGVSPESLTAIGYGDAQPIADNAIAEGRIQNRRTTVIWSQE